MEAAAGLGGQLLQVRGGRLREVGVVDERLRLSSRRFGPKRVVLVRSLRVTSPALRRVLRMASPLLLLMPTSLVSWVREASPPTVLASAKSSRMDWSTAGTSWR